jgi:hypothetical protein
MYIMLNINKNEKVDITMIIIIYKLILILFCKKWKNISKKNKTYLVYQFLIITLIKKNDNFVMKSNIINIIMKL